MGLFGTHKFLAIHAGYEIAEQVFICSVLNFFSRCCPYVQEPSATCRFV